MAGKLNLARIRQTRECERLKVVIEQDLGQLSLPIGNWSAVELSQTGPPSLKAGSAYDSGLVLVEGNERKLVAGSLDFCVATGQTPWLYSAPLRIATDSS